MRHLTGSRGRAPRRPGFTLSELLIAVVLVGMVGASIITVLIRQQRFYRATSDLLETRSQIRQALSALPSDLRSVSSASGDIRAMSATEIDFDATIGSGIVCETGAALLEQDIYLLPPAAQTARFTGWVSAPQPGDRVAVYSEAAAAFSAPMRLRPNPGSGAVMDLIAPAAACAGSPFLTAAGDNLLQRPRLRVDLTQAGAVAAAANMPVRVLRRVRYSLEQAPDDAQWYLAYREFEQDMVTPKDAQILSGPYRPLAADTTSGLSFAYFDAAGAALPNTALTQVARVEVVVRGLTAGGTPGSGSTRADGRLADSDRLIVGLRN